MDHKKPLSPHIQVYRWHISSLVSISHRITGIVNIIAITIVCFWITSLLLGEGNYGNIKIFLCEKGELKNEGTFDELFKINENFKKSVIN